MPHSTMARLAARATGVLVAGAAVLCPTATAHAATTLTISPGQTWSTVLAQAQPGDTVVVSEGTYPAQRLIGRDYQGVTVVGASRTGTVVQGLYLKDVANLTIRNLSSNPVGAYDQGAAFKISYSSNHITLDDVSAVPRTTTSTAGFDVSRGGTTAPQHILISDAYYDGEYVTGSGGRGLRVWGGNVDESQWPTDVTLLRAKFTHSSADLVQIGGGVNVTVADSRLYSPQPSTEHNDGIQSYGSRALTVRGNVITAPGDYVSYDQGIILGNSSPENNYLTVTDSVVRDNTVTQWHGQGITLAGTDQTEVSGNTVDQLNAQASAMVVGPGQWGYTNTRALIEGNVFSKVYTIGATDGVAFGSNTVGVAASVASPLSRTATTVAAGARSLR
jgi:hypothetical protein